MVDLKPTRFVGKKQEMEVFIVFDMVAYSELLDLLARTMRRLIGGMTSSL